MNPVPIDGRLGWDEPVAQPATSSGVAGSVLAKGLALSRSGPMAERLTALQAHRSGWLRLPPGYDLEYGADVLLLRRADGSVAATFSAKGATPATVASTAEEDHRRNHEGPA
jgi:hypothetical protein